MDIHAWVSSQLHQMTTASEACHLPRVNALKAGKWERRPSHARESKGPDLSCIWIAILPVARAEKSIRNQIDGNESSGWERSQKGISESSGRTRVWAGGIIRIARGRQVALG
jgi:hypothetical protein